MSCVFSQETDVLVPHCQRFQDLFPFTSAWADFVVDDLMIVSDDPINGGIVDDAYGAEYTLDDNAHLLSTKGTGSGVAMISVPSLEAQIPDAKQSRDGATHVEVFGPHAMDSSADAIPDGATGEVVPIEVATAPVVIIDLTGSDEVDEDATVKESIASRVVLDLTDPRDLASRKRKRRSSSGSRKRRKSEMANLRIERVDLDMYDEILEYKWYRREKVWKGASGSYKDLKELCSRDLASRLIVTVRADGEGIPVELSWEAEQAAFIGRDPVSDEEKRVDANWIQALILDPDDSVSVNWDT